MATPPRTSRHSRSKSTENFLNSENSNPNIPFSSPPPSSKTSKSPASKSVPTKKSNSKTPSRAVAFPVPIPPVPRQGRKFIVAKKNLKIKDGSLDFDKCRKEAYEALRASQEEFFRKKSETPNSPTKDEVLKDQRERSVVKLDTDVVLSEFKACKDQLSGSETKQQPKAGSMKKTSISVVQLENPLEKSGEKTEEFDKSGDENLGIDELEGSSKVRKMRTIAMKKALDKMPEPGSGLVKHLVQAFESLQLIKKKEDCETKEEGEDEEKRKARVVNWALPGLQPVVKARDNGSGPISLSSSAEFISFSVLERDSSKSVLTYSTIFRSSWEGRTSGGGRRSRRSSSDSLKSWNRKLKVTSQHPFKLRTEQRGRIKEEQFMKKVEEMILEQEKMRIPVAQGLPWTTDEPECLVKPPVKERTEPIDLVLHSDVRAVERAEYDNFVTERLKRIEEIQLEREQQRKLEEEEEIRRLRKEQVPKAQPMPFFDCPFIPKRSTKPITVPKEPRFHLRPEKSSCVSISTGSMIEAP
ncbi:Protein TPX2 [Carex littledalei]|uniref:Protein TPX2 n=1 Tax=Carex littledalei TaxID=544730 RepID=A0A833R3K1_9POAL|nr:Protein TPX2 [Carex littledalei]